MSSSLYPTYIAWKINLVNGQTVDDILSPDTAYRTHKAIQKLHEGGTSYTFGHEVVTLDYLARFVALYQDFMGHKERGVVFDVQGKIEAGMAAGKTYESISLKEGDVLLGGLLYSVQTSHLSVAYRVFPYTLKIKLPISFSYVAEQYLLQRALDLGVQKIIHGRDRNVYGVNASIGLAEYKTRIGCVPHVSTSSENIFHSLDDDIITQDTLVFLGDTPGAKIREGILFTNDADLVTKKYSGLLKRSAVPISIKPIS